MKYRLVVSAHLLLLLTAYSSWLWVDYRIIILGVVVHLAILWVFRGCPLSHMQFPGDTSKRFYEWLLEKIGIVVRGERRRRLRIFMMYILPLIIIVLAVLAQVHFSVVPLVRL